MLHTAYHNLYPQPSDQYFRSLPTKQQKEKSYGNLLTCIDFAGSGRKTRLLLFTDVPEVFASSSRPPPPARHTAELLKDSSPSSCSLPHPKAACADSVSPCLINSRDCSSPALLVPFRFSKIPVAN